MRLTNKLRCKLLLTMPATIGLKVALGQTEQAEELGCGAIVPGGHASHAAAESCDVWPVAL